MADGGEIRTGIVIEGDDESKQAFTEAGDNADKFGKKMEGVGSILKKLGAVAVAFVGLMIAKGINRWLQESTRLASIQQDALHDLGAAYRQLGEQDVKGATENIAAFASELQNASVIGDEATIKAAALGVRMGLTGDILKKTLQVAADLSATFGTDLNANMTFLTEASANSAMSLQKFGAVVDQSLPKSEQFATALGQINEQFAGAAAAKAQTYSGAITQLGNAWGDLREIIGASTTESTTLRAIIIELTKFIGELTGKIKETTGGIDLMDQGFQFVTAAVQTLVVVGGSLINAFLFLKTVGAGALWTLTKGFEINIKIAELLLAPLSKVLDALAGMGVIDTNPLREGFETVGEAASDFADKLAESMVESVQAMENVDNKVDMITEGIGKFRDRVYETKIGLKDVEKGVNDVKTATEGLTPTIGEQEDAFDSLEARTARYYEMLNRLNAKAAEHEKKQQEERLAAQEELASRLESMGHVIANAFEKTFSAIVTGAKTTEEAMVGLATTLVNTMVDAIGNVIIAEAAKAAAGAASGMFSIPIIGPALAVGAAAAAFGMVKGMLALLPKAAYGGYVTGGTPGVDSVGVLVQRGEGILQTGQTNVLKDLANSAQQMARNGMLVPAMAGGGGNVTVHYAPRMMVPDTSAGHKRTMRDLQRGLKKVPGKLFQGKA